jgi:hypothetical protein
MRGWWLVAPLVGLVATDCAVVAGLSDFERAEGAGAEGAGASGAGDAGGGGSGGAGGAGGGVTCNATDLVISELRTIGSNGATDDLVEIFNPTASPISLEGYTLTARAPTSAPGSDFPRLTGTAAMVVPAYGHLLIAGEMYDDRTPPDVALGSGESFGNDVLVFLKKDTTPIDVLCVCAMRCDEMLWGECEGFVVPNPATVVDMDVSLAREPACVDNDAPVDFTSSVSSPLNLASPPTPP